MPPLRMLRTLACLSPLASTACAPAIPWPPRTGSCIEAYKPPGRRTLWQLSIDGRSATYDEVERIVYFTPELRAIDARARAADIAIPFLIPSGI